MIGEGMKNAALSAAFVAELGRSGVRHAVVCPGSRSTPLALALADSHDIRIWLHIDERSAAFFALGMARSLGEPVAVLCSSGTAAANFLPAVVEASLSRIPLLVLTADRPPELRDVGAAQTMDQVRLYGGHVKWFHELPVPEITAELLRQVRFTAARAVATALAAPRGPVHLNFPTREPLVPAPGETVPALADEIATAGRGEHRPFTAVSTGPALPDAALAALAADLASTERGLIVCGPQDDPALAPAVARLAAALGYPLLADGLSQTRSGPHDRALVIDTFDAFLRDDATCRALAPEVVLRFGAPPTSKPLAQYLARYPASRHLLIDGVAAWRDPAFLTSDVLHADPVAVCDALADHLGAGVASCSDWTATWLDIAARSRAAIDAQLAATDDFSEGRVFAELAALLPDGATLYAGNSMPVRDLDTFLPAGDRAVRCLSNRGANGIDGVNSSALGVAAVSAGPVVLVIGDLSFFHDLNGLLAAKLHHLRATIVVVNNDGGGIFSFLPQATAVPHDRFEQLFGTPIGLDYAAAAALYGATFHRASDWSDFRTAVANGIAGDGLSIVEVCTERA
ncbi:MAG: 2-succinyl-5-enolpyruvyl-6-hydroxy-3-cyclohexene-1-carboxylic-acid synthase, partial [Chloroflexia bacterium]